MSESKLPKLLQCSDSEKQAILKHYGITEADLEDYIDTIVEWLAKTNLPKNDDTRDKIKICLYNGKMSIEEAKKSMAGYYRMRTMYSDFFDKMMPLTEEYNRLKKLSYNVVMPKLSPDLCRISIFRMNDPKADITDGFLYHLVPMMMTEIRIKTGDTFLSNIIIVDFQGFELKHFIKYTPTVIQKLVNLMLAIKLRLKGIHFVNTTDIVDRVMGLVKAALPNKFIKKVCTHRTLQTLYEYIPKEYLPSDYNGDQPSVASLYEEWCEELERREEDFKKLLNAKSADDIDKAVEEREVFGIGCDGSFKKLSID